jgi:hypothetical protein
MIFPDNVIACRAGHQAMGADIILAILAALADMILTIGLFTDTAGYGMILTYPFVTITAPGTMGDATGRYPRISSIRALSDSFGGHFVSHSQKTVSLLLESFISFSV